MTDPLTPLPPGPFQLILADPPWAFRTYTGGTRTPTQKNFALSGSGSHAGAGAGDHYPTMPLDGLKSLDVAGVAAPNALLAMWVVGSHCDEALELGAAWGFTFVTDLFYWMKQKLLRANQIDLFTGDIAPPKISMGYHTRKQLEPVWLFKRGKGLPVLDHSVRQLIIAPPSEHSRKPPEQYDRLDALYGTQLTRLELFSRTPRTGWTSWGNETGKFSDQPECAAKAEDLA